MPPIATRTSGSGTGTRGRLKGLIGTIEGAYGSLIKQGREADAFALREATQRFANAGAKTGISSTARISALADLKARMSAASRVMESKFIAQQLRDEAGVLDSIATIDAREFQQGFQTEQFEEQKASTDFSQGLADRQFAEQQRQFNLRRQDNRPSPVQRRPQFTTTSGVSPSPTSVNPSAVSPRERERIKAEQGIIESQQAKDQSRNAFFTPGNANAIATSRILSGGSSGGGGGGSFSPAKRPFTGKRKLSSGSKFI